MADFQFRTRGQQNPQGKQRVYFTCHPDDFEKYFKVIQKEILDRQDCAIFYLEPGTQPRDVEDYELRLLEMQLFVIPVTTKLLTKANRAINIEVPFAFENHIPVLPLMQESGLDEVFNARFGNLQYLYRYGNDPSAISFDEKLTKYLESVLVGDELAKKVRAAFDAYIFLSYRKKDRKYAQELMKLIHSNPLCRDIAIWYDEFLVPGENFNDAIRKALEKSELFALTVTPNIVNEINYILTTEYPLAREMGKKILPAEMEPTDREKLHRMFEDIPEIISNGDLTLLIDKLSSLLEPIAICENDTDPQHIFFIGLAYLSGIDMEINHERALELITRSAESDYIPAIEKLFVMYKDGEGVKRNPYKAITFKEQLVDCCRRKYFDEPNESTLKNLLKSTRELGKEYESIGQLSLAKQVYEDMINCSKLAVKEYSNIWFWQFLFHCYNDISYLTQKNGELSEAEQWCNNCICDINKLSDYYLSKELSIDLANSYICLGDVFKSAGKLPEAKKHYLESIELCNQLLPMTVAKEMIKVIAIVHLKIGDLCRSEGQLDDACWHINKALSIYNQCLLETKSNDYKSAIASCYEQIASISELSGNYCLSEKYYSDCYIIRENVYRESESMSDLYDLCIACYNLGRIKLNIDVKESKELYERGYAFAKALIKIADTVSNRRQLAIILDSLGDIERNEDLLKAQEYYFESCGLFETLVDETESIEMSCDLALCYEKIFIVLMKRNLRDKALFYGQKCLCILERIARESQKIDSYNDLARALFNMGNALKSRDYLDKAITLWIQLYNVCPNIEHYKECIKIALECKKDYS